MKYDKETVVGVLEQMIKRVGLNTGDAIRLEALKEQAERGYYSTPTLKEVWKEKTEKTSGRFDFIFEFEGQTYYTEAQIGGGWTKPREIVKL